MTVATARSGRRRTQSERSEEMRGRLKSAAFEVVATGGLDALRIATVAEQAGVSQGAVLHHFPNKNAITLAAVEQALELANAESVVWDFDTDTPSLLLKAMVSEFRGFFFSDRFWVAAGITIQHTKDTAFAAELAGRVAELRDPIYAAWVGRLESAGWANHAGQKLVRSCASLLSGAAIRRLWSAPDSLTDEILADWIDFALAARG
ncbi:MAG: TetR/AcrR family transcriptional regulator [Caenibius sp.]